MSSFGSQYSRMVACGSRGLFACALVALSPVVSATPVVWTLNNVTTAGGQTISGSFVFDAATVRTSSISITNSGLSNFPATIFDNGSPGFDSPGNVLFLQDPGLNSPAVLLSFSSNLTNAGGEIPLRLVTSGGVAGVSRLGFCNVFSLIAGACSGVTFPGPDFINGGSVVGSPVPLPAAGWLLVTGLAGFGGAMVRRRRKAPAAA
jgi:hypothetical protein